MGDLFIKKIGAEIADRVGNYESEINLLKHKINKYRNHIQSRIEHDKKDSYCEYYWCIFCDNICEIDRDSLKCESWGCNNYEYCNECVTAGHVTFIKSINNSNSYWLCSECIEDEKEHTKILNVPIQEKDCTEN
jgi:hypothetical protein